MFYRLEDPLPSLPAQSQVKASNLINFQPLVEQLGGNHLNILERYEISPDVVGDESQFIDCRPFVDMLEHCSIQLNDPLFGLHLAQSQEPDVYGFVAAFCRASPDFRTAVTGLVDYLPVMHSSECTLALSEGRKVSELSWTEISDMGENTQASYQGLMLNLKILRMLEGSGFVPSYINLPRSSFQSTASKLGQTLGCQIRLSDENASIAFPTRLLDNRLKTANQPLFKLLSGYLSHLKSRQAPSLKEEVNTYIRRALSEGEVSIEGCSQQMDVSARTLQLRLKAENLSFSALLEQQRLEQAKAALQDTRLSIAEVADSLGYAERTSFGRAFKRWTGVSPQQYRNDQFECHK